MYYVAGAAAGLSHGEYRSASVGNIYRMELVFYEKNSVAY